MKRLIFSLTLTLICATVVFAQTQKVQSLKYAVISFAAFEDEKNGIKDLIEAIDKLNRELKPQKDELKVEFEKLQKLVKEIEELRLKCKVECSTNSQIENLLIEKIEEHQSSQIKLRSGEDAVDKLYKKRKAELTADIYKKIWEALKPFVKEKGYLIVNGLIDISAPDVTNEFIEYYNENFGKVKAQ
jgi:Skp family chaperone for outer membrane proteins